MKIGNHNRLRALKQDNILRYSISKDQCPYIEETSVHLLSYWLTILVKDHQHTVTTSCQRWWSAV